MSIVNLYKRFGEKSVEIGYFAEIPARHASGGPVKNTPTRVFEWGIGGRYSLISAEFSFECVRLVKQHW